MEKQFQFELLTPEQVVMQDFVQEIIAPGIEGYFGVQTGHLYFVTTLKKGVISVKQNSEKKQYFIDQGIIQVTPKKVVICAEKIIQQQ